MDDDKILQKGGSERDIEEYAKNNGADMGMNHLQTIREKVIAANPEIMELKFGCEGVDKGGKRWRLNEDVWRLIDSPDSYAVFGPETILGRPIRLADVLMAMKLGTHPYDGVAGEALVALLVRKFWNLRDDNLEKQSPETLKFINELLK